MELEQERQAHRDFSGRHGKDEDEHHLPVRASPLITSRHECETACVQHDLDGQQREDEITPREKSDQTQREQCHR